MSLTGQLSDLSLAELIEFFCNQRKTGRLKIIYPQAPGYFYIQAGSLVDAKIGGLSGVEAVYYALTLPNASFKFSPVFEATRRTIHQPWTQVVLEGLRRIDEGIAQTMALAENESDTDDDEDVLDEITESEVEDLEAFKPSGEGSAPLPMMVRNAAGGRSKGMMIGAAAVAVLASVAIIGVPAGWYGKGGSRVAAAATTAATDAPSTVLPAESAGSSSSSSSSSSPSEPQSQPEESRPDEASAALVNAAQNNEASMAARREREARDRERLLRVAEERANASAAKQGEANSAQATAANANLNTTKKVEAPHAAPKAVSVQVTYDEAGRVTQASGGDATALRIARQKRFPAGKPGSTTVTIPIN